MNRPLNDLMVLGSARIYMMRIHRLSTMQVSFSELEYAAKKKVTRRDRLLGEIDAVSPWSALVATSANVYDVTQATALMHGKETKVWADSGYHGIEKRPEAQDLSVDWKVAIMPGKRKNLDTRSHIRALLEAVEKAKARSRAIGEHPFHYIKNVFGLKMVRLKGLAKDTAQLFTLFGLADLLIARRLLSFNTQGAS